MSRTENNYQGRQPNSAQQQHLNQTNKGQPNKQQNQGFQNKKQNQRNQLNIDAIEVVTEAQIVFLNKQKFFCG